MAIKVVCGPNSQCLDPTVAGQTVADMEQALKDVLNIPDGARPIISGDNVENNYVLRDGDTLEFLKPSGGKG